MRLVIAIIGAILLATSASALIGAKRLDEIAAARSVLAVRSGAETFLIPTAFVRSNGLRVQLMRLAGCWDARDGAYLPAAVYAVDCGTRNVALDLPTLLFGADVAETFRKPKLDVLFWPSYSPPPEDFRDLSDAYQGRGDWTGRQVTARADWKLWRVESAASPWVFLLSDEPKRGDAAELSRLYAGRCYRPERVGDAGMTCKFALRTGASAALEFSLGPDEMMSFPGWREGLQSLVADWRDDRAIASR